VDFDSETSPDLDDSHMIEYDAKLHHDNDSKGRRLFLPGLALDMPEKMEAIDESNNL
jgi:hypothetical protein